MDKYKNYSKGYYWIFISIKILSWYAFAIPVYRKDARNMIKVVTEYLRQFKNRFRGYPELAQIGRLPLCKI